MNDNNKSFLNYAMGNGVNSMMWDSYKNKMNNMMIDPNIIEERSRNITQLSVFSRLFMERILFVGTEITPDVANIVNSQLLFLAMEDPKKPITMYINTPGGSVNDGLSIYDTMNYISCPVHTTGMGLAASMGSILISSGEKGNRTALPNTKIMIHQPLGGVRGQASDIEIEAEEIKKCKKTLYEILAQNTGKSFEEIWQNADRNKWFTAKEAVDFGLIDEVITKK